MDEQQLACLRRKSLKQHAGEGELQEKRGSYTRRGGATREGREAAPRGESMDELHLDSSFLSLPRALAAMHGPSGQTSDRAASSNG